MKQRNIAIGMGIVVVLVLMAMATAASASASAFVQPNLTLTTDKSMYNWNETPQVIFNNTGNTKLYIEFGSLYIKNSSGAVYHEYLDIVLNPKSNYTEKLILLPAGKYFVYFVYPPFESNRNIRVNFTSNVFVVAPPLTLTTKVYGCARVVKFNITNPGTRPIDLSPIKLQVYTVAGVPIYNQFSLFPSYSLQPNKSWFTWSDFEGIRAGTYQAKMTMQTSNGVVVINGDLFTVK